jgi:phosphate transport system permease protein
MTEHKHGNTAVQRTSARRLRQRYAAERRFRFYGLAALLTAALALLFLLGSIFTSGLSAFERTMLRITVHLDPSVLGVRRNSDEEAIKHANYNLVLKQAVYRAFPEATSRREKKELLALFSAVAPLELQRMVNKNKMLIGFHQSVWLSASSPLDQIHKGNAPKTLSAERRLLSDLQLAAYERLRADERVKTVFNRQFFTNGDSRYAENAGIAGAVVGSALTLLICFLVSFPLGVSAALYLEEFAPKRRWTEFIEVNINNLAAVPSIIFGLLGLAVLLNTIGLPRGTPLVGGLVLSLLTLPTIIIACRASLKAVPPSIREGALAMGASHTQVIFHHVLPLALPGTLTGAVIGLARALGETAPLLMIGMVAFIVDIPGGPLDPSAVLPVQIYLWAESAERGFLEKTYAAIMIIVLFLVLMNAAALYLRAKLERRW